LTGVRRELRWQWVAIGTRGVHGANIVTRYLAPDEEELLRHAMLSASYHAQGTQLTLRDQDAPAVQLLPEGRLLTLAEALETLRRWPDRLRHAVWRLVRAAPVARLPDDRIDRRYPSELLDIVPHDQLAELDERRRTCRAGAQLFAAALVTGADRCWDELDDRHRPLDGRADGSPLGHTARELLAAMVRSEDRTAVGQQVAALEDEVGLTISELAEALADAVAFADFAAASSLWPAGPGSPTIQPVASVARQDAGTLTTTATTTTLVQGDLDTLGRAIDPRSWPLSSDVIQTTRYVGDAFALDPLPVEQLPPIGKGWDGSRLLEETAAISWRRDAGQQAWFHNVLRIDRFTVDHGLGTIDLEFSLSRSIRSRVLWDERAGGILLDEGYLKVRPLGGNCWRVTGRKALKFGDRTPHASGPMWSGLGQLLNLVAPAALIRWLETDMYHVAAEGEPDGR
jgi:hypothetical protein